MKIDYKTLLYSILIPVFLGSFVGFLTASYNNYSVIKQPVFAPPGILFPIVWIILYVLMGVSCYLIIKSNSYMKNDSLFIYGIQLIINLFWSIWFFVFRFYFISFIWILLLIGFVVVMIKKFYKISKISAYLQIPYLLWLVFAGILNLSIFILNV
jgi:tryptophan-rich sensory protein